MRGVGVWLVAVLATACVAQEPAVGKGPYKALEIPIGPDLPFAQSELLGKYLIVGERDLELLPGHRYLSHRYSSCGFALAEPEKGTWEIKGDTVLLRPDKKPSEDGWWWGVNTRYVPVVWNGRIFLADEYQAPDLCYDLKSGKAPAKIGTNHLMREDGVDLPLFTDLPNYVPERFREFLGRKAVECKLIAFNRDGTVTLDKGKAEGLRPGLMLGGSFFGSGDVEIISVKANSAVARPVYFYNSQHLVELGDRFFSDLGTGTGWDRYELPQEPKPRPKKTL